MKRLKEKMLHNDGFFFTFIRSSLSSQVCGWIDTLTAFLAFALLHLTAWFSTCLGAFVGGICNYLVNYRFTFHATGMGYSVTLFKFVFIWAGSLLLNSFGTEFVYKLVSRFDIVDQVRWISKDGVFLAARLSIALTVSLAWNFQLQRKFVFNATRLDPYIERLMNKIGIGHAKKEE